MNRPLHTRPKLDWRPAAARAHQEQRLARLARMLKLGLPILALTLMAGLFAWSQWGLNETRINLEGMPLSAHGAFNIVNAHFDGIDAKGRPFYISAAVATQLDEKIAQIGLTDPKADMRLMDGSWVSLTAKIGTLQRNEKKLLLQEEVSLFQDDGFEFRTSQAAIDLEAGQVEGEQPIVGQGPFGELAAEGFSIQEAGNHILLHGKSSLNITSDDWKVEP